MRVERRGDAHVDTTHLGADLPAKALTTAPPARKLATICAVTSCGHGVTPCACTPWSPAKTATAAGSGSGGGQLPAMPASCDGDVLEHAERPRRLGHPVEPLAGRRSAAASRGTTAAMVSPSRVPANGGRWSGDLLGQGVSVKDPSESGGQRPEVLSSRTAPAEMPASRPKSLQIGHGDTPAGVT